MDKVNVESITKSKNRKKSQERQRITHTDEESHKLGLTSPVLVRFIDGTQKL